MCANWNAVERAVVLAQGAEIEPSDLGLSSDSPIAAPDEILIPLAAAERRHILAVLDRVGGNKTRACKILGIGRGKQTDHGSGK